MSSKTKASKIKHGKDILSLNILAYTFTGIVAILCLIPFIMIVSCLLYTSPSPRD